MIKELNAAGLETFFTGGCAYLSSHKEEVNALNVFPVPDGDTGTNMSLTITSAVKDIAGLNSVLDVARNASKGALMGARGNSGVILSQIFRGFANGLEKGKSDTVDTMHFAVALQEGVNLAYRAVMRPVEGTILTVCRQMAKAASQRAHKEKDVIALLEYVVEQGQVALNNTPNQLPVLKQARVVDAGGKGLLYIFQGGLLALKGEKWEAKAVASAEAEQAVPQKKGNGFVVKGALKYGYCTEFILYEAAISEQDMRDFLADKGDSQVVVGVDDVLKVHVHTNDPGKILSYVLQFGTLHDIKIDNMNDQHRAEGLDKEVEKPAVPPIKEEENVRCGVVAVCSGEGLTQIFMDLGVSCVVNGGQSMNPSAEDILNAIEATSGKEVVVLPNNGNIFLAAQQAAQLTEKPVQVLATKHIPQGLSAMLAFDPSLSAEENAALMNEEFSAVHSGQVTYAVRDSSYDDDRKAIKEGDFLGLAEGKIVAAGPDMTQVVQDTLKEMVFDDASLITLLYGENVAKEDAEVIKEQIQADFPDMEVDLEFGGQAVYYYILSVE